MAATGVPSEICSGNTRIESCPHLHRIAQYLDKYKSVIADNLMKVFHEEPCANIDDDFVHMLDVHLGDTKPVSETNQTFERTYKFLIEKVGVCELEGCSKFQRNNRNRESDPIRIQKSPSDCNDGETDLVDAADTDIDDKGLCRLETLDTMHTFFFHSYDLGYRIKHKDVMGYTMKEAEQKMADSADGGDELVLHKDPRMQQLVAFLSKKRERLNKIRGAERSKNSKFISNVVPQSVRRTTVRETEQTGTTPDTI